MPILRLGSLARALAPLTLTLGITLWSPMATHGAVATYLTPSGSVQNKLPVNAKADITTGDGTITIVLTNLQADPKSVIQNVSGLLVTFGDDVSDSAIYSGTAKEITISGKGTNDFEVGSNDEVAGWVLSNPQTNQIFLNVLGSAVGPAHTLIGPPNSDPAYAAANGSITNPNNKPNSGHDPFLNQTVSWTIAAPNVTSLTTVTGVAFSFGTSSGNNTTGEPSTAAVPEPSTFVLAALGLPLGLLAHRRSRRAA